MRVDDAAPLALAEALARLGDRPRWAPPVDLIETSRARAQHTAETALELLPSGLAATSEVLDGTPLRALTDASATLDLLVCGPRGYGALRSAMVGGVSRGLAHHAQCPLLVVPRGTAERPPVHATDPAVGLGRRVRETHAR